jgi:diaminopimelate epimerase
MRLRFTKMQGAGNDFIVLDAVRQPLLLSTAQARWLADRHFGVGADQILIVEPADAPGVDFRYRILNASGEEVEHCGNGARCFVRYVHGRGLTDRRTVRVQTVNNLLELQLQPDGGVTVDMNRPVFALSEVPFDAQGLLAQRVGTMDFWPLPGVDPGAAAVPVAVLSMGNPHAVLRVDDVDTAPVADWGPRIERHRAFPRRVNAGFVQVLAPDAVRLRVWERGAGETLACGTGACAAVVAGIRAGWLGRRVAVHARGGVLHIEWPADDATVRMTGPAEFVFDGEIDVPEAPQVPPAT